MHPLQWIYDNRDLLQAISSVLIAALTLILIVLTGVYVRANWRTMRLMEADLKYRSTPLPSVVEGLRSHTSDGWVSWAFTITVSNAPMLFEGLRLIVKLEGDQPMISTVGQAGQRPVAVGEELRLVPKIKSEFRILDYTVLLWYFDITGTHRYETTWTRDTLLTKPIA